MKTAVLCNSYDEWDEDFYSTILDYRFGAIDEDELIFYLEEIGVDNIEIDNMLVEIEDDPHWPSD